jgi:hypothetical protein
MTTTPFGTPIARLLRAIDAKSAGLALQVHGGWHAGVQAQAWPGSTRPARQRLLVQASQAVATMYGVRWPGLNMLRPRVHRVAVLEREPLLRVLAAAALHAQRFTVRQIVSKAERVRLCAIVGEPAYRALVESTPGGLPAQAGGTVERLGLSELAEAGCRAIATQNLWRCRDVLTLVRLALAPDTRSVQVSVAPARRGPLMGFEERLDLYFPEFAWLFGSEMDRALSASKTA